MIAKAIVTYVTFEFFFTFSSPFISIEDVYVILDPTVFEHKNIFATEKKIITNVFNIFYKIARENSTQGKRVV